MGPPRSGRPCHTVAASPPSETSLPSETNYPRTARPILHVDRGRIAAWLPFRVRHPSQEQDRAGITLDYGEDERTIHGHLLWRRWHALRHHEHRSGGGF